MKKLCQKNLYLLSSYLVLLGVISVLCLPSISLASDIYDVTDFMLFSYIPSLIIPFIFAILLIGFFTRFSRRLDL